jgi:VCBS repeat-containing protein
MKNRRDNRKNEIKQTAKFVTTIIVATLLIMAMPTPAGAKVVDATPTVIQPIDDYVQDMIGELSGGLMIGDRITVDLGLIFEDSEDLEYTVFTYNNSVAAVTIQSGDLLIDANSAGSTRVELIVRTSEQGIPIYEQFLLSVDSIEDMDGDGIGIDDIIKYNFERPDRLNATFLEKALDQIDTIESPANTAPTTHPAPYHINVHAEDQVTLDMSSFFSDPDGDELDYEFIDVPTSGSYIGVGLQDGELTVDGSTSVTMVTVSASDGEDGHFVTKQFYISIFNRAPSSITLTGTKTVAENSEPNLVVGELTAMDLDAGDNHTFSLTDNDNNSFSIVNNSLRAATSFNYEVKDTYSIVIRATDQDGLFVEQPFTISVMNENDAPKAVEDVYATDEDTLLSGNVLSNDTDEDGDSLTVIKGSSPTKGTLALQVDGTFTYMPDPDSNGVDNFTYKLYDGITYSEPATVMIQVNSVNDAPIAQDNTYTVNEDELLEVKVVNGHALFDNDYDPEGGPIFAELVADVTYGELTLSPNGEFNYKPNAGFTGPDYFTYRVRDNDLTYSNYAYVTITVLPVNHAP